MEVIAEINDLACHSIESGDYRTALDALNCSLGCVKRLKMSRLSTTEKNDECNSSTDGRKTKTTKEIVATLLKGAKRKLMNRTVAALRKKHKASTPQAPPTTNPTASLSGDKDVTITRPLKKRRLRLLLPEDTESQSSPSPTTTAAENAVADSSRASECSFSMVTGSPLLEAMPSLTEKSVSNPSSQYDPLECCPNDESEEQYFVYRKPLRFTKFQWSRIEYQGENGRNLQSQNRKPLDREVELTVSSILIFNIALSHHLIASPLETKTKPVLSPDSDDTDDDENSCGYDSSSDECNAYANNIQKKQRLKGALRLYELGFRVHTKRVAYIASSQNQLRTLSSSSPTASTTTAANPRGASVSSPSTPSPSSGTEALRQNTPVPTRQSDRGDDLSDELKYTTRFALALLNNCTDIHKKLGQVKKAAIFQKRLLSFLLVIVDSGESIHDIIGDNPAVDGYLKNVYTGTIFDKETSPAAMA